MAHPAYAAAKTAESIRDHFAEHLSASAAVQGGKTAVVPEARAIKAMVEAAFWASLRREEGYMPRISLAFVAPEAVVSPMRFGRCLPLEAQPLTKLAPAVERPGIHLGVWPEDDRFTVWGTTRHLPAYSFVLEVVAPGLLVIKHSRGDEPGKFVNVAVFQGDEVKLIDQDSAHLPDCPDLLSSLLGLDTRYGAGQTLSVLIQLAVSMRAHGRGGLLLVVPSGSEAWRESVVQPVLYSVEPPFSLVAEIEEADALERAIEGVAGLTAVDGATVLTDEYAVLAFGAKIVRRRGTGVVPEVMLTEPIEGGQPAVVEPAELGGTRHLAAAQFVHDQHDAVALVASQDGRFTVFAWSGCEGMVHAHRIESLLL